MQFLIARLRPVSGLKSALCQGKREATEGKGKKRMDNSLTKNERFSREVIERAG